MDYIITLEFSDVIASLAFLVTLIIGYATYRLRKRIYVLETSKEKQAEIRAEFKRELDNFGNLHMHFVLKNIGRSEAVNIRGFINDKRLDESGDVYLEYYPIDVLGPDSEISLVLISGKNSTVGPKWIVKLIWDDDSSKDREFRTILHNR